MEIKEKKIIKNISQGKNKMQLHNTKYQNIKYNFKFIVFSHLLSKNTKLSYKIPNIGIKYLFEKRQH